MFSNGNQYSKEGAQTYNDEHEGRPSMALDETVWCVCALLEDNHCVTDMWWEMAACFSHEASEATILYALQQLKMWKLCTFWVPQQLMEEHQINRVGVTLNFLIQYEEDGDDLLQ